MIIRWIVGVALLFGILMMMLPKTDEKSLAKIASQSMLMCTKDFREHVARKVVQKEAVAVEFQNKCPDLIAWVEVDASGEMVIAGKKHPLKMTLSPVVEDGRVRWSCRGEPAASVTSLCRGFEG
ncbi:MAG: hypothetical protein QG662_1072 [Pseudomonadota bacterium]|nr:hypothetical protein [Pseudomonadota bacterium]